MISSPLIWGLVLGLGSSLHCSGMCGPIGCSLLLLAPPGTSKTNMLARLAAMQLGRILSYTGLGIAFGTVGASLYGTVNFTGIHLVMQWTAAVVVIWLGLSTAGLAPSFAGLDRALTPIAGRVAGLRLAVGKSGPEGALLAGLVWGITPCAMVFGAIFNSLLTGDPWSGGIMMLAFGLGTVPAVAASSLALHRASRSGLGLGRTWSGALMILAGVVGLLLTVPGSPLCITH